MPFSITHSVHCACTVKADDKTSKMATPVDESFEEYSSPVNEARKGRKRTKDVANWQKTKTKSKKYKSDGKTPCVSCNHNDKSKCCDAALLSEEDIQGR